MPTADLSADDADGDADDAELGGVGGIRFAGRSGIWPRGGLLLYWRMVLPGELAGGLLFANKNRLSIAR